MNKKQSKKPFVIAGIGIVCAISLVTFGLNTQTHNSEQSQIVKTEIKILTDDEQFENAIIKDLILKVENRFEDEISQKRASVKSKELIKEFSLSKVNEYKLSDPNKVYVWGDIVKTTTVADLNKWNEEKNQQFIRELEILKESNKQEVEVPVEEIAQNNPMYVWQETKIIQRELFEQWKELIKDNIVEVQEIDLNKLQATPIGSNEVTEEKPLLINESAIAINNQEELKIDDVEQKEKKLREDEIKKIKEEIEKAHKLAEGLEAQNAVLESEYAKQEDELKKIQAEITKTKNDLIDLDKRVKQKQSEEASLTSQLSPVNQPLNVAPLNQTAVMKK